MAIIVTITERTMTTNTPSVLTPTLIGESDKKDYIVKLKLEQDPESEITHSNVIGLRLYLGCYKSDEDMVNTTSNCRLSVIGNSDQRYSAIDPINPVSNNTDNVLRYIIPDEDVEKIFSDGDIKITVQLETSQDSNEARTPQEGYVLKAHIEYVLTKKIVEYTKCEARTSEYPINFEVIDQ